MRGAWDPAWRDLYTSKGCDGLRWRWETRAKGADLAPVLGLPNLRLLELKLRGVDDSALAGLTGVEELELWSSCSDPLDLSRLHGLLSLGVQRPTPIALDGHTTLESLWISGWHDDPVLAPSVPGLRSMRIEGAPGGPWIGQLGNLDAVPELTTLWLDRFIPDSLDEIGRLRNLERLYISSHPREAPEHVLDLEPLQHCSQLQHLHIGNCRVKSVQALRGLPRLLTLFLPVEDRDRDYDEISAEVDRRYHAQAETT